MFLARAAKRRRGAFFPPALGYHSVMDRIGTRGRTAVSLIARRGDLAEDTARNPRVRLVVETREAG